MKFNIMSEGALKNGSIHINHHNNCADNDALFAPMHSINDQ